MMNKLFAVYLGGYAPTSNLELHDMVFVVGASFESTYPALVKKWFMPVYDRLHYDGYADLSVVDGHKVTLSDVPVEQNKFLYFIHLGGYDSTQLNELHYNCFVVAEDAGKAKLRAKSLYASSTLDKLHKDTITEIESCILIEEVDQYYITLLETSEAPDTNYHLGYNIIPKEFLPEGSQ